MISALAWIPRGVARSKPIKYEISPDELSRIQLLAKEEEEYLASMEQTGNPAVDNTTSDSIAQTVDISDLPSELQMDKYDSDEDANINDDMTAMALEDEMEELRITEDNGQAYAIGEEEDEDDEDNKIQATDSLLVAAVTEDDFSHLEVHVLTDDGTLYVHHDITLPDFPLCLAWLDCPPFLSDGVQVNVGNYMAVGTFDPAIEIWNLDVLDPLEPSAVLGGVDKTSKNGKKKSQKMKSGSHEDSILCLSWNLSYRQLLASGSADKTVKIWDVTTQQCLFTFTHHSDKVQAVQFHAVDAWLLASGGFDKEICLVDCRSGAVNAKYTVLSDLEAMVWNPFNSDELFCSLEDGSVVCVDRRKMDKPIYSFQAHDKTTSSLSFSYSIPGMLATSSVDKVVKIWDVANASSTAAPILVAYKAMSVGKLFSVQFYPSSPYVLAAAGDKGIVAVWETDETAAIEEKFSNRIVASTFDKTYEEVQKSKEAFQELPAVAGSGISEPEYVASDEIMDEPQGAESLDDESKVEKKINKKSKKKSRKG